MYLKFVLDMLVLAGFLCVGICSKLGLSDTSFRYTCCIGRASSTEIKPLNIFNSTKIGAGLLCVVFLLCGKVGGFLYRVFDDAEALQVLKSTPISYRMLPHFGSEIEPAAPSQGGALSLRGKYAIQFCRILQSWHLAASFVWKYCIQFCPVDGTPAIYVKQVRTEVPRVCTGSAGPL